MTGNRSSGSEATGTGSHRLADSSTPSRAGIRTSRSSARPRGVAGWPGDRGGSVAVIAASLRAAGGWPGARARPVRRSRHAGSHERTPVRTRPQRPVAAPLTTRGVRERLGHRLARRGHPARRSARHLRPRPLREPGGRRGRPRRRRPGPARRPASVHDGRDVLGDPGGWRAGTASRPWTARVRELREETGVTATDWREIGRLHLSNSVSDEAAVLFQARAEHHGDAEPDGTEQLEVRWLPFEEALAMTLDGRITDALSVCAIQRVALERRQGSGVSRSRSGRASARSPGRSA